MDLIQTELLNYFSNDMQPLTYIWQQYAKDIGGKSSKQGIPKDNVVVKEVTAKDLNDYQGVQIPVYS